MRQLLILPLLALIVVECAAPSVRTLPAACFKSLGGTFSLDEDGPGWDLEYTTHCYAEQGELVCMVKECTMHVERQDEQETF